VTVDAFCFGYRSDRISDSFDWGAQCDQQESVLITFWCGVCSDVEFDAPDVDGSALVYIAVLGAFWLDMGTTADYSNML